MDLCVVGHPRSVENAKRALGISQSKEKEGWKGVIHSHEYRPRRDEVERACKEEFSRLTEGTHRHPAPPPPSSSCAAAGASSSSSAPLPRPWEVASDSVLVLDDVRDACFPSAEERRQKGQSVSERKRAELVRAATILRCPVPSAVVETIPVRLDRGILPPSRVRDILLGRFTDSVGTLYCVDRDRRGQRRSAHYARCDPGRGGRLDLLVQIK